MREILQLDVQGHRLVGTYHPPEPGAPQRPVGFLFLNAGHVPRDGHAGLAARASDLLARRGFPCFRFDFPGLGDSPGEVAEVAQLYYAQVCDGGLVELGAALVEALRRRYGLAGVVVGGLCGAAVTGTYLADRDPEGVRGLLLFEPEFYVTEPPQDGGGAGAHPDAAARGLRARLGRLPWVGPRLVRLASSRLFSFWGWMRLLTAENEYARLFRFLPFPRQTLLDLLLDWDALPDVANVPLAQAWQRVVARGTPALVLTAQGKLHEVFFDRVNRAVLGRLPHPHVEQHRLAGTNHIFTTGGAIERTLELLLDWSARLPLPAAPSRQPGAAA